jgi:hypothetical protein
MSQSMKTKTKMMTRIKVTKKRKWKKDTRMDNRERKDTKKWRTAKNKMSQKAFKMDTIKSHHPSRNIQNKWMNE